MKYLIIHIDDRAIENINKNKEILNSWDYVDSVDYFNSRIGNYYDVLNHKKIRVDSWNPYDGRTFPALPGEYGIFISLINTYEYIVDNDVEELLVLEDDVVLYDDFLEKFSLCKKELPEDYDFLSLYYFDEQNTTDETTDIGLEYIQKSNNQYSAGQALLISKQGAKKILNLARKFGMEYTSDCFIFHYAQVGSLNGYSIKPDLLKFLKHDYLDIKSSIDPENIRDTPIL